MFYEIRRIESGPGLLGVITSQYECDASGDDYSNRQSREKAATPSLHDAEANGCEALCKPAAETGS
jgi:hypothetical protein